MTLRNNHSGFSVVELAIVVAVVAALGFIGYSVYSRQNTSTTASTATAPAVAATQSPIATNVSSAPQINSTADLDAALNELNQNDPSTANSSDSSLLTSQSATF